MAGPVGPARPRLLPMLLVAAVAGVLALAAAGTAGFLIGRSAADPYGPARCDSSSVRCIPTLDAQAVVAVLQGRGFECPSEPNAGAGERFDCQLRQGSQEYVAVIYSRNQLIQEYSISANYDQELGAGPPVLGFLNWFAMLPFGLDPEAQAAATDWLAEATGAGGEATAEIRGYRFAFSGSPRGGMSLHMTGGYA